MALTEDEFDNKNDATTLDNEEVDEIEDDFFTDDDAELERRMVTPKVCFLFNFLNNNNLNLLLLKVLRNIGSSHHHRRYLHHFYHFCFCHSCQEIRQL